MELFIITIQTTFQLYAILWTLAMQSAGFTRDLLQKELWLRVCWMIYCLLLNCCNFFQHAWIYLKFWYKLCLKVVVYVPQCSTNKNDIKCVDELPHMDRQQELKKMLFFFGKFTFVHFCSNASERITWSISLVIYKQIISNLHLVAKTWLIWSEVFEVSILANIIIGWDTSVTWWNILPLPLQNDTDIAWNVNVQCRCKRMYTATSRK